MKKALAATTDCNSRYCFLNPYRGAQIAVAEAARNLVCTGAEPAAVTDCLNFGNPEKPDRFWQFKNCVTGIADACKSFQVPVVSGNVSFYNESPKGAINPTPTIGMIGIIADQAQIATAGFKDADDLVILLGETKEELGGTEYLKSVHRQVAGDAPQLDLVLEKRLQETVLEAIKGGFIKSAHDCAEGGLAVALAECCFAEEERKVGVVVDNLPVDSIRKDALFFGESQSRVVLSCQEQEVANLEAIARKNQVPFRVIGRTGGDRLVIGKEIDLVLEKVNSAYRSLAEKII